VRGVNAAAHVLDVHQVFSIANAIGPSDVASARNTERESSDPMANQKPNDANNPAGNQGNPKNAPRTDGGNMQGDSGSKPSNENRQQGREGMDAPRNEQNRPAGKPAPQYDDRPSQQRGGSSDTQNPAAPLPNPKTPAYGDQEESDPRRLDVDAGGKSRTADKGTADKGMTDKGMTDKAGDKTRSGNTQANQANDAGRTGGKTAGDSAGKRA